MKKSFLGRKITNNSIFIVLSLIALFICLIPLGTIAQTNPNFNNVLQFTPPPPPTGDPPTGRLRGGASRGECPQVTTQLMALATVINSNSNRVWGLTTFDRPTFWFYLPYTKDTVDKAEFVLQDSQEDDVYRNAIVLPKTTGIIGITIPETIKNLEVDRDYTWYFKVYCSVGDRSPLYVRGIVKRVNLPNEIAEKLLDKTPQQQLKTYAANGIWYDTLTLLAKMRLANPNEPKLAADWFDLLENNGLGELKNIEILAYKLDVS
jgi:Domain of Unknown Function (DUF928)